MSKDINTALHNYIMDPKYPLYNFELGKQYEDQGHNASALSFYLRTAEFSMDKLLCYESLLRMALCIEKQGNRMTSLKAVVLRAISLIPDRPEAIFMMCRIYEYNKDYHEGYAWSIIGENLIRQSHMPLITDIGYPGAYAFSFEKAVCAWWIGLYDESIHILRELIKLKDLRPDYEMTIKNNIASYGYLWKKQIRYDESQYNELRMKFPEAKEIKENYSQCYQDMFVLTMLNGKKNGSFLEIGCGDPWFNNNTALLEKKFEWWGTSIEINDDIAIKFHNERKATVICADATQIDYKTILGDHDYDYLQIDCDPAIVSFQVLQRIPLDKVKFAVITFEHDYFCDENKEIRDRSRKYLESFGYVMVVNNISEDRFSSFEDWWVHPDFVDQKIIGRMKCISDLPKKADDYMLGRI